MLQIKNLSFSYGDISVLKNLNLEVKAGQLVALTGVSGSGKSTLLKLIHGAIAPNKGVMSWKKIALLGPDFNLLPGADFMKYLAQDFDLMPFTSVAENISQHLSVFDPKELLLRTQELLNLIDMEPYAHTKVKKLSGGQQQRVALAKVLAKKPELLLLDEPFSHIDPPLKDKLRNQLFKYVKQHKIACIIASHHPEDYMGHAHEIICLEAGQIKATGSPEFLYNNPPSESVAQLLGTVNSFSPEIIKKSLLALENKAQKSLLIWPHEWKISQEKGQILAVVVGCYFKGDGYLVEIKLKDFSEVYYVTHKKPWPIHTKVQLHISLALCKKRLAII